MSPRRMCQLCGVRPARFRRPSPNRSLYRSDNEHDLCRQCEEAGRDARRAGRLPASEQDNPNPEV
jgi:hypothetical protein